MRRSHVWLAMIVCAMFGGAMAALYMVEPPAGGHGAAVGAHGSPFARC
jgi:hypothetical protein